MSGERQLPGMGLYAFWNYASDAWGTRMDSNLRELSTVAQLGVLGRVAALPGSPAQGDIYLLTTDDTINCRDNGVWVTFTPLAGWVCYVIDEDLMLYFDSTDWTEVVPTSIQTQLDDLQDQINTIQIFSLYPRMPKGHLGMTAISIDADANNRIFSLNCAEGSFKPNLAGQLTLVTNFATGDNPFPMLRQESVLYIDGDGVTTTFPIDTLRYLGNEQTLRAYTREQVPTPSNTWVTRSTVTYANLFTPSAEVTFASPPDLGTKTAKIVATNRMRFWANQDVMLGFFIQGQSWSQAPNDANPVTPAIALVAEYSGHCFMPGDDIGVRIGNNAINMENQARRFSSFEALVETSAASSGQLGETPASGLANHLFRDLNYWFPGTEARIFACVCADGGARLDELTRGGPTMEGQVIPAVTDWVRTAQAEGYLPIIGSWPWTHGQAADEVGLSMVEYINEYCGIRDYLWELTRRLLPWQDIMPLIVIDQLRSSNTHFAEIDEIVQAGFILSYMSGFVSIGPQYITCGAQPPGSGHPMQIDYNSEGQRMSWATQYSPPLGQGWCPLSPDITVADDHLWWTSDRTFRLRMRLPLDRGTLHADLSGTDILVAAKAKGVVTWAGLPANGNTLTIKGTAVTFVTSGATGLQVNIGATVAETIESLYDLVSEDADANLAACQYVRDDTTLTVISRVIGTGGNAYTLARVGANMSLSGATLAGGVGLNSSSCVAQGTSSKIIGNAGFDFADSTATSSQAASVEIVQVEVVAYNIFEFTLDRAPEGYGFALFCAARQDGVPAGTDALHGGGRCCFRVEDGDDRWHQSIYDDPLTASPHVNQIWPLAFKISAAQ
jgi:hypothetical protein